VDIKVALTAAKSEVKKWVAQDTDHVSWGMGVSVGPQAGRLRRHPDGPVDSHDGGKKVKGCEGE
jgi:hypothetical protein